MLPHEAARSLAWFVVAVIVGIAVVLWWDIRKDAKANKDKEKK